MGETERNLIEEKVKSLMDRITDQQDLFDKRECTYKEEITRLKPQLKEVNNVRNQYKEKEDQCQILQDEVTSLRNEANEKDTIIKKLKDRSGYYESLEDEVVSLK